MIGLNLSGLCGKIAQSQLSYHNMSNEMTQVWFLSLAYKNTAMSGKRVKVMLQSRAGLEISSVKGQLVNNYFRLCKPYGLCPQ